MVAPIDDKVIKAFWGNLGYEFICLSSSGKSEGIVSIWEASSFSMIDFFKGDGFLLTKGVWSNLNSNIGVFSFYAPQQLSLKRKLCADILELISSDSDMVWIITGDFNSVRDKEERMGTRFSQFDADAFNQFIEVGGLCEVRSGGRKFTRISKDGSKLSKLDRFLVSTNYFDCWQNPFVEILPRRLSDHCPVLLKSVIADSAPVPFKFFDSWLLEPSLEGFVAKSWYTSSAQNLTLTPMTRVLTGLRHLKNCIKTWRASSTSPA